MRLIDDEGTQVGIVTAREAQQIAEDKGLDLVEVAPNAVPPVCRLMDYGKFRYEQSKKEREARKNQRQVGLKEVRLRPKTDDHDLEVKANQARRFLRSGDKVKFTVRFRGREMAHPDIGREMLEQISDALRDLAVVEQKPAMEGRAFSLVLAPNAKVLKSIQQAQRMQNQADQAAQRKARPTSDATDEVAVDDVDDHIDDDIDDIDGDDDIDDIDDDDIDDIDDDEDEDEDEDDTKV